MFFTVRYSSWASDFGGKAHLPAKGKAFQGCSNRFERLKRYLAVSSRTQTSAFGRMRELPSRAVRENTDRQTSSSGCKIRAKRKTEKGFLPVPTYATLCQRLPVIRETIRVPTFYCLFAPTNQKTSDHLLVGRLRETYAPMAIGWLQPTLGCPFLRLYLRKENWQSQPTDGENVVGTSSGRNR